MDKSCINKIISAFEAGILNKEDRDICLSYGFVGQGKKALRIIRRAATTTVTKTNALVRKYEKVRNTNTGRLSASIGEILEAKVAEKAAEASNFVSNVKVKFETKVEREERIRVQLLKDEAVKTARYYIQLLKKEVRKGMQVLKEFACNMIEFIGWDVNEFNKELNENRRQLEKATAGFLVNHCL